MHKNRVEAGIERIESLRAQAIHCLHILMDAEMQLVMKRHVWITAAVRCMGEVTLYTKDGPIDDADWPPGAYMLRRLVDLDPTYEIVTGKPLRLTREGLTIKAEENW